MTDLPFPPGSSLAAYVRDSGGADQEFSTDQQAGVIRAWCEQNGYQLTRIYADVAKSGKSMVGRDQLDEMLRYFYGEAKEAGIVLWDLSRWARNYDDAQITLATLRKRGYQVYSLEEKIPPGSVGKIIESLHLWSAEQYREALSRNVKRGLTYIIREHKAYPRPNIPVGYIRQAVEIGAHRDGRPHVVNRLAVDPATANLVRQAFSMRAAGASIAEIAQATHLHKDSQGYLTMLTNPIYRGVFVFGSVEYPGHCEPLIDQETWDKVQAIRRQWQERMAHPRRAESTFLLSGLVRCALCGRMLAGSHSKVGGRAYRYYRCNNASGTRRSIAACSAPVIPVNDLDQAVLDLLTNRLLIPDYLSGIYAEIRQQEEQDSTSAHLALLRSQSDVERLAIRNITAAIHDAGHSRALLETLAASETHLADLERAIAEVQQTTLHRLADNATDLAASLRAALLHADFRDRQLLLRSIIKEISAVKSGDNPITSLTFYPPGTDKAREFVL